MQTFSCHLKAKERGLPLTTTMHTNVLTIKRFYQKEIGENYNTEDDNQFQKTLFENSSHLTHPIS